MLITEQKVIVSAQVDEETREENLRVRPLTVPVKSFMPSTDPAQP